MSERTKLWIAEAMKRLMVTKSIDQIRVTELCREAKIERPTFYYHFKDKYDLVAWIFYSSAVETDVIGLQEAADSLKRFKQDYLFYKRAYEDSSQNALWKYMLEYFTEQYTNRAKEMLGVEVLDPQLQFSIRLYCYGGVGMAREWLLYDNITPAETAVDMMFHSMPESLRAIYFQ